MVQDTKVKPPAAPQERTQAEFALLDAVRSILLKQDRETLRILEARLLQIEQRNQAGQDDLRAGLDLGQAKFQGLQNRVANLEVKSQEDMQGMVERLTPAMTNLIRRTIHDSPQEMAEAIGPVMGEAIRVQIRDSREDMVEALSPVIGQTVQKAVGEFVREIQRNIDGRLRTTFGPSNFVRQFTARLRGVSDSELALRGALPFAVQQIFLIQHGSGLLLAHWLPAQGQASDSDLVGAMLTAIRDFVRDAFSKNGNEGDDLDEISYGEQRIVVQSGQHAYIAVVFNGIEPEGFRGKLRNFMAELHLRYSSVLRDYNGDPAMLPNFEPVLNQFIYNLAQDEPSYHLDLGQRRFLVGISLFAILALSLSCFYLRFTWALLPVAFPSPMPTQTSSFTPTPTSTLTATPTPTLTSTLTPTPTATHTATVTPSPTSTATPTITPTPSQTPTMTITPTPVEAVTLGSVWVHLKPAQGAIRFTTLPTGTAVKIIGVYGDWYNIQWVTADGLLAGWVYAPFITVKVALPANIFTPTVTPTATLVK